MKYNPEIHKRKSIRLKGYDYSKEGLYFITICMQDRKCLFGKIENNIMILNDAGQMVEREWLALPNRFPQIILHEYIVMPNHFHSIFEIVGAPLVGALDPTGQQIGQPQGIAPTVAPTINPTKTVGDIIGAFKSIITDEYIKGVKKLNWEPFNKKLLQRDYWEHIIRNQKGYDRISNYIINNPKNWKDDTFFQ